MPSPEERVIAGLTEWAGKARAGKIRWLSLVRTPLQPGEKVSAMVRQVMVRDIGPDEAGADLDERAWHASDDPTTSGMVVATDQRLMLVGNGNKVVREWPWPSVEFMRMSSNMRAMLVKERGVEDSLAAILREQFMLLSSPKAVEVATNLISLEGAWYLWQGQIDGWLDALPRRFSQAST